jgi:hypothetical protein
MPKPTPNTIQIAKAPSVIDNVTGNLCLTKSVTSAVCRGE